MDQTKTETVDLESLFKTLVWDNLVKLFLQRLFVLVPALGWGPLGWIVTWAVTLFLDAFYTWAKKFINFRRIELLNAAHLRAYDRASVELGLIARDKGIDSPEFEEAREKHKQAIADLVRFDIPGM